MKDVMLKRLIRSYTEKFIPCTRLAVQVDEKWYATGFYIRQLDHYKGRDSIRPFRVFENNLIRRAFASRREAEAWLMNEAQVTGK